MSNPIPLHHPVAHWVPGGNFSDNRPCEVQLPCVSNQAMFRWLPSVPGNQAGGTKCLDRFPVLSSSLSSSCGRLSEFPDKRQNLLGKKVAGRSPGNALHLTVADTHRNRLRAMSQAKGGPSVDLVGQPILLCQLLQRIDDIIGSFDVTSAAYTHINDDHSIHAFP